MEAEEADRLIDVAGRVFAQLGFDGASLRMVAETAGVDAEELDGRFGGKAGLYRQVMLRAHEREREALSAAAASFTSTRQGVLAMVDAYLDFHVAHPETVALWMQRWMGDAADIPDPEEQVRSLSALMVSAVEDVAAPGIDTEYMIWTIVWCVHGFLAGGIQHPGPDYYHARGEPLTSRALENFRAHLHALITRLTLAPGEGGATAAPH